MDFIVLGYCHPIANGVFMELHDVFLSLKKQKLCKSGRDFSEYYLGQGRNYYSVIRAQERSVSTKALMNLYFKLRSQAEQLNDERFPVLLKHQQILREISGYVLEDVRLRCIKH